MRTSRKLTLKRDELAELDANGLARVAGGDTTKTLDMTCASCLDYISCWWWQCLTQQTRKLIALETEGC